MGMKISKALLLLTLLVHIVSAQGVRKVIIWSEDPECDSSPNLRVPVEKIICSSSQTDRGKAIGIEHNGLRLVILPQPDSEYFTVGAALSNSTQDPFMFDSDTWIVAHYRSMAEFREGKPPLYRGRSLPSRTIIQGLRAEAQQSNSLDSYIASTQTSPKTVEFKRSDGSTGRMVVRVPNEDELNRARERSGNRSKLAEERQEEIRKHALTAKTVMPKSSVAGMVYFERKKNVELSVLSLAVGEVTYVFGIGKSPR